jgi:hypothetical protein
MTPHNLTGVVALGVALAGTACGGGGGAGPPRPAASIVVPRTSTASVAPGGELSFEGRCPASSGPVTHAWSFPGGTPSSSTAAIPGAVRFDGAGTFTVSYRCTDSGGQAGGAAVTVQVGTLPAQFSVALQYAGGADAYQADFEWAAARLAEVVRGPVPGLDPDSAHADTCDGITMSSGVGHLALLAMLKTIDGQGGTLALSSPCVLRASDQLPVASVVRIDSADVAALQTAGTLRPIILHEMLHALGFGVLWGAPSAGQPGFDLLAAASGTDPYLTGVEARAAFRDFGGGGAYAGNPVPVEAGGGTGTRAGHWRKTVFADELMTGSMTGTTHPMSRTTMGSLADLGYLVDFGAAEPFLVSTTLAVQRRLGEGAALDLSGDLGDDPPPRIR